MWALVTESVGRSAPGGWLEIRVVRPRPWVLSLEVIDDTESNVDRRISGGGEAAVIGTAAGSCETWSGSTWTTMFEPWIG